MRSSSSGFTILDLVACIGLSAVVSTVGVPAVRTATSDNSLQRCRYNYRFISQASAMYQEDFGGQMWALSWPSGMLNPENQSSFPLRFGSDFEGHSFQAYAIARRRAGITKNELPMPTNSIVDFSMTHLALADYVGLTLPASSFVCPMDGPRQVLLARGWSNWPVPSQELPWIEIFSTSYAHSVYHNSPSRQSITIVNGVQKRSMMLYWQDAPTIPRIDGDADSVRVPGVLGPRQASAVAYPSAKVFLADYYSRHEGATRYYAYSDVFNDLLFYDGSLRRYRTDFTNPGWDPRTSTARQNMQTRFPLGRLKDYFGGVDGGGRGAVFGAGWYRWTRGGLLGWDVPRLSSMVGKPPNPSVVENELDTGPATGSW